jgi:hypothetical protein
VAVEHDLLGANFALAHSCHRLSINTRHLSVLHRFM